MENKIQDAQKQGLLPEYTNPNKRSTMGKWNDICYERRRRELQEMLTGLPLHQALEELFAQQTDAGFIQDDLGKVRCFQCYHPKDRSRFFLGQYNPTRADRMKGSGRSVPPPGVETKQTLASACYLCGENIRWQSRGVQLYYQLEVNGHKYNALCNPFPFMPTHITIAADEHEPQSWHRSSCWPADKIERIVTDLFDISMQLPDFATFYNGDGAGASIENHFHFQTFRLPSGHGLFPLQQVAAILNSKIKKQITMGDDLYSVVTIDTDHYPLDAFRVSGNRESVIQAAVSWIKRWSVVVNESASANIAALWENKDELVLYIVPRNKFFSRAPGMAGIVGGLEVLGEFIFCTKDEDQLITSGQINRAHMDSILQGVRPPDVDRLKK